MAKIIAIPGTEAGYYHVNLVVEDGRSIPTLVPAHPAAVGEAKEAFEIVLVAPLTIGPEFHIDEDYSFPPECTPRLRCPVELSGEGLPAKVGGVELPTAAGAAYRALAHLIKIFPAGVKREVLNHVVGVKDVSGALGDLLRRDGRWAGVLRFPRRQGEARGPAGVYSISPQPCAAPSAAPSEDTDAA
jgi:hypothetical protein